MSAAGHRRLSLRPLWIEAAKIVPALLLAAASTVAAAADWPMYRHDPARSAVTEESLPLPLAESWQFRPAFGPQPAWGDPKPEAVEGYLEGRRIHFDDVFQPVAAGGAVLFGSSADNKLYCLDAANGQIRWTFITGGPIRLAPTVAEGRVYAGSDDGWAYCLDVADGSLVWKFHAAPAEDRVLGHGRMISLWPLRCGVLVDGGVAYLAAGVFPAEGVFLYAVDAKTGEEIWRNGTLGEAPQSRISPQGYFLASPSTLYAPMGRVSPAAFDRANGGLKYVTYFGKAYGGTFALLAGEHIYTGTGEMIAYGAGGRDRFAMFAGHKLVVDGARAYVADDDAVMALDREKFPAASRKLDSLSAQKAALEQSLRGKKDPQLEARLAEVTAQLRQAQAEFAAATHWKTPLVCHDALVLAGDAVVAGGEDRVVALSADSGKIAWESAVDGRAKGLAVSDGRLVASTDAGAIYAFAGEGSPQHGTIRPAVEEAPFADSPHAAVLEKAAEQILETTGKRKGYCLVVGLENGQLAYELAKRSELSIYAVDPDAKKVAAARRALDVAGVYGGRVCVERWPLDAIPYADYFADLVVFEKAMVSGGPSCEPAAITRMLKPCGGALVVGRPGVADGAEALDDAVKTAWRSAIDAVKVDTVDRRTWTAFTRGPLEGAGNWTHLYGNAANTACGDDRRIHAPLGVLWFGHPGPGHMVNRHARAAGPLSFDGRLFIQGENIVMAYDAYNGRKLWEREIAGAMRTNASHDGGNLAVGPHGLFVAVGPKCLRLDPATGETVREYPLPTAEQGAPGRWGYVACQGDLLYGSRTPSRFASDLLFAVDVATGELRWQRPGRSIVHNTVAVRGGRVYFIDSDVTDGQRAAALDEARQRIAKLPETERAAAEKALERPDVRAVTALDAKTGDVVWRRGIDVTDCGGSNLCLMTDNGVLVIFGVYLDGHYWKQFFAGEFDRRRVTVLSAEDGGFLWSRAVGYRVRPVIVGDTLHTEPWAFDLKSGEPRTRTNPITGQTDRWQFARPGHHCGLPIGTENCLFFRSYCFGYYDLATDSGTMHFGAQRPGCWINFIPAAGLLLMPEASAGCMCPFPNMCSVAFKPAEKQKAYSYFSVAGSTTPVKRLALNFGAPGDRRDAAGKLWLGFPRPQGSLVLQFPVDVSFHPGGSFDQRNSAYTPIQGTDDPWLYATAARGLRKCVVPLLKPGDGTALYQVRLFVADPDNAEPGRRVFDVKLQGKVVRENVDPAAAAGGRDKAAVVELDPVEVTDKLTMELVPKTGGGANQLPIVQAVEVIRQQVTGLGCAVPEVLTSSLEPEKTGEIRLANLRDEAFEGTLRVTTPEGFTLAVRHQGPIELASGGRAALPLTIRVADGVPAGNYEAPVELLRSDGSVELGRSIRIEHLGPRGRVVLHPVEDAFVHQRYPGLNKGTAAVLLVDGGHQKIGDQDHALAYLKFKLDVPGKPLSATLRLQNAGNPSGSAGRVCLAEGPWKETGVVYEGRPKAGRELAQIGAMRENQVAELDLPLELSPGEELSLMIDATSCDGVDYGSRESDHPPELIVDFEPTGERGQ